MISESIASQFSSGSLWLALIGLALATLLSGDLTYIRGDLLVAARKAPFRLALGACVIGIFMGGALLANISCAVGRSSASLSFGDCSGDLSG